MKSKLISIAFLLFASASIHAQQTGEARVPLTEHAIATDASGREAIAARLRTTDLRGSLDSPVTNIRLVLENRSSFFYTYVSGWVTFYDSEGVRCGEGLFKLDALAVGESAETDTPGLRLRCAPVTWRVVATNLLTRTSDTAKPNQPEPTPDAAPESTGVMAIPALEIVIDGEVLPLQLGNPIEINTRRKSKVHLVVNARP
jgi:hypothetical protein